MCDPNYKMILSSSILVPDKWLVRYLHKTKGLGYDVLKYDNYPFTMELNNTLDECIKYYINTDYKRIMEVCKLSKNKVFRHVTMTHMVIGITDISVDVHVITNQDGKMIHKVDRLLRSSDDRYLYIARNFHTYGKYITASDNIHYVFGFDESTRIDSDAYQVFKISLNHISSSGELFGDNPEYDNKHYFDINDKLKQLPPKEYYDYCMRLIGYEQTTVVDGTVIDARWITNGPELRKAYIDFLDPETFNQMMQMKYPIYWERTDG